MLLILPKYSKVEENSGFLFKESLFAIKSGKFYTII